MSTLRLATRGSPLAMVQSEIAASALRAADPTLDVEYVIVRTEGDIDRTSPLHQIGGRGVFVRAVELALLDGRADIAMHSLKDVPTAPVEGQMVPSGLALTEACPATMSKSSSTRQR